jgi:shikimate kinase
MNGELYERKARIFLTGFMGSGKTTVGPILANSIGYSFVDLDREIEASCGKSVKRIFEDEGEQYFRSRERGLLEELVGRDGMVIALGGGTLTDPAVFDLVQRSGLLVYLKVPPEELFKRLQRKSDRPLLMDAEGNRLPEPELRDRLMQLYARREPLYAQADIIIFADEKRLGLTIDHLVRMLTPLLR